MSRDNTALLSRFEWQIVLFTLTLMHLCVFWATITQTYAMADDFYFLDPMFMKAYTPTSNVMAYQGRPILGALIYLFFGAIPTIGQLFWIRLFAIVCSLGFSLSLYSFLKRMSVSSLNALLVASVSLLMPSWCTFIGWASCFPYPLASFIALWAGIGMLHLIQDETQSKRYRIGIAALCFGGIFISANIYQISACYYFVPICIFTLLKKPLQNPIRRIAIFFGFFAISTLIYLVANKLYQAHLNVDNVNMQRMDIDWSIQPKINYIVNYLIPDYLINWGRLYPGKFHFPTRWILGSLLSLSLLWHTFIAIKDRALFRPLILIACILASIAPLILTSEFPWNFRTRAVMEQLMVLLLLLTYPTLFARCFPSLTQRLRYPITIGILLMIAFLAKHSMNARMIEPSVREYTCFTRYLSERFTARPNCLIYLDQTHDITQFFTYTAHEFMPSASIYGFIPSSMNVFLNEVFGKTDTTGKGVTTTLIKSENPIVITHSAGIPVMIPAEILGIPYTLNLKRSFKTIEDPNYGHLISLGENTWLSDWLGPIIIQEGNSFQFHVLIGWICVRHSYPEGIYLYNDVLGDFWTSRSHFPGFRTLPDEVWRKATIDANGIIRIVEQSIPNEHAN
jgi:hypothetical protein